MRTARAALLFCVLGIWPIASQAQSWDSSGNNLLNGTYYFRQVLYIPDSANDGGLSEAISFYGNIAFSGSGTYTITNAVVNDSGDQYGPDPLSCYLANSQCTGTSAPVTGTYSIAASGYGFISSPLASGDSVYGLVSNGIFIASSTETGYDYNDLFIAAPVGAATPSFTGTYTMAGFLPAGSAAGFADVFFQMSPSGGNLGTVNISGYYGQNGAAPVTQSSSGVKYTTGNGAAIVTFPNNANAPFFEGSPSTSAYPAAVYGPVYLYFSPDGSFCFGGSPDGWDMIVGVRNNGAAYNPIQFSGLYYTAGLDLDTSTLASGYGTSDSYYGSLDATGSESIIEADRLSMLTNANAYTSTYSDSTTDTTFDQYAFTPNYAIGIGAGVGPYLGLKILLQAPTLPGSSGQSVYLDPTSLQNAGSFAPFTAGVSPGEFIVLYGTNLASKTVAAPAGAFPTSLGGVQVIVNGVAAPLYFVSAGQIEAIIPYETTASVAAIQVSNGTTASNLITAYVYGDTTGVFTENESGIGYAAAVHNATGQVVKPSNPAVPGEYLQIFLTGLGTVYPTIQDGALGPTGPLSAVTDCLIPSASSCMITATINGISAPIVYAGLAPALAGLYQIDLQVPTTDATSSNQDQQLAICGPDSCTAESLITVSPGGVSALDVEKHASALPRSVRRKSLEESVTGRTTLPRKTIGSTDASRLR